MKMDLNVTDIVVIKAILDQKVQNLKTTENDDVGRALLAYVEPVKAKIDKIYNDR